MGSVAFGTVGATRIRVPAATGEAYTFPVTRDDVENVFVTFMINPNPVIDVAAIGLTPISPVMWVVPVVEIPVLAIKTKSPDVPRFTVPCTGRETAAIGRLNVTIIIVPKKRTRVLKIRVVIVFLFFIIPLMYNLSICLNNSDPIC